MVRLTTNYADHDLRLGIKSSGSSLFDIVQDVRRSILGLNIPEANNKKKHVKYVVTMRYYLHVDTYIPYLNLDPWPRKLQHD